MTDTVEKLIVALDASQYKRGADEIAQSGAAVSQSAERIVASEEKVTKATRTTADGFQRLEARYDPLVAAERRRSAAIAQATRYLDDGSISQERYRAHVERVTRAYDAEAARAKSASTSLDQHNIALARMGGGLSQVTNLLGAFGVTMGVAGVAQFGRHVIDSVGNLGEQAQQIGLNVEQFQVYRAKALQAGASQEQLTTGVQKFTRTIEEAVQGQDDAIGKFRQYGISILDVNGKQRDTSDILQDVAVKVANASTETERGKIAFDLFGRSGQNLIPTLLAMSSGYAKNAEEAKKLGMVVGDDLTKKYDELGDAMERAKVKSVVWGAEFGEAIWNVAKLPFNGIVSSIESIGHVLDSAEIARVNALEGVGMARRRDIDRRDSIITNRRNEEYGPGWKPGQYQPAPTAETGPARLPASESQIKKSADFEKYLKSLEQEAYLAGFVTSEREKEKALFDAIAAKGAQLTPAEKERVLNAMAVAQSERERWKFIDDTNKALENVKKSEDARNRGLEKFIEGLESQPAIVNATGVELEVNRALYEAQNKLIDEQGSKLRDLTEVERTRIANAVRTKAEIEKEKEASKAALRELEGFADRAFDRIGGSITQMFVEGKGAAVNWKNTVSGLVSELYQEFMKLAVINPVKNALFGGSASTLSGLSSGLFSGIGGLFSGGGSGLGDWGFTTASSPVYARDGAVMTGFGSVPLRNYLGGGIATSPQAAIFAENSTPEAFVPVPSGRIPVEMRGGARPSVVMNQTNNIDARGADPSILPRIKAMLAQNKQETVQTVFSLMNKGGAESRIAGLRT